MSKQRVGAVCLIGIMIGLSVDVPACDAASLASQIEPLIKQHRGQVAVAIKNLKTGESFQADADVVMPTASLIKLPILIEAYRQVHEQNLDLQQKILLNQDDKVPGSGVLTEHFSVGTQITLRDALRLMIAFSDNTATNLVIDRIGLPATSATMEKLGCPNTKLHAKVFRRDTSIFPDRSRTYGLGSTTANEMVSLLERITQRKLVNAQACEQMMNHLSACDDRSKLARFLPPDVKIAHKSGSVSRSRTDAGLIETPRGTVAICVLTNDNRDNSWSAENAAEVLCGRIAKIAFDVFSAGAESRKSDPLVIGAHGDLVETLQRTLNARLALSPGLSIDGDFGPMTKNALESFQRSQNLDPTGIADEATWKALSPLVTQARPVPAPDEVNRRAVAKQAADPIDGRPFVTCQAWTAIDAKSGGMLGGDAAEKRLHPASTTKIMTAFLVMRLSQEHPEILNETVTFSSRADNTVGSTAAIRAGESLSVLELLYGLLLPSGNDASVALAEHFGDRFQTAGADDSRSAYESFVQEMNDTAASLGMKNTTYANTHGLTNEQHLTTAKDLATLARNAMRIPLFRRIVATHQHGCTVVGRPGYSRNVMWTNSNRLLKIQGYDGVKTGTTQAAGACLVSHATRDGKSLIVVVLGSASTDARYVDTRNLFRWAWKQVAAK